MKKRTKKLLFIHPVFVSKALTYMRAAGGEFHEPRIEIYVMAQRAIGVSQWAGKLHIFVLGLIFVMLQGLAHAQAGVVAPTLPPRPPIPSLTYYVSPAGSDHNNGTSSATPFRTLEHINGLTGIPGNTAILLQGGQTFMQCLAFIKGGNVASTTPMAGIQLSTYGAGLAKIISNCAGSGRGTQGPKSAVVKFDGINGVFVSHIIADCNNTGTQYGILAQDSIDRVGIKNVTISGNTAKGCNIPATAMQDVAADIAVLGYNTIGSCSPVDQVLISGNAAQGTSVTGTDDTGILIHGCASRSSMNVKNVTIAANTVTDIGGRASGIYGGGSGNGILVNGGQYVEDKFNIVTHGGANTTTCGGPGGIWAYNSDNVNIHNNEVNTMDPAALVSGACDWLAYDLDGGVTNSIIQYNHSDNNWGNAWEFYINGGGRGIWSNNTIRYNISENDTMGDVSSNPYASNAELGIMNVSGGGVGTRAYIYNNTSIVTKSKSQSSCLSFNPGDSMPVNGVYANNLCYLTGLEDGGVPIYLYGSGARPAGIAFLSNGYGAANGTANFVAGAFHNSQAAPFHGSYTTVSAWAAVAPGGEAGTLQTAPGFTSTPSPGACPMTANVGPQPCPAQLTLGSGSAYKGVGTNLSNAPYHLNVGSHDYYGNVTHNSAAAGPNIGAYGGN